MTENDARNQLLAEAHAELKLTINQMIRLRELQDELRRRIRRMQSIPAA